MIRCFHTRHCQQTFVWDVWLDGQIVCCKIDHLSNIDEIRRCTLGTKMFSLGAYLLSHDREKRQCSVATTPNFLTVDSLDMNNLFQSGNEIDSRRRSPISLHQTGKQ